VKVWSKILIHLVVAVILLLLFNFHSKTRYIKTAGRVIVIHDTIQETLRHDTIIYRNWIRYKKQIIKIDSLVHDTVLVKELLVDYGSDYYYNDTIINDSNLIAVIKDTISQNKIKYRSFHYALTQTINKYEKRDKRAYFVGGGLDFNNTYHIGFSTLKKRTLFGASYNFQHNTIQLDIKYRIR